MIKEVLLPDLGEGIDGAEVSEITVSVGDVISKEDTVLVLESDKASMEIPAEEPGVVKEVLVSVGDSVAPGVLLLKIETHESQKTESSKEKTGTNKSLTEVLLPDLGEGIEGAEVSEIMVSVGDVVSNEDTVLVLESDKASMEIPAECSGVVKEVLVSVGDSVSPGVLLLKIKGNELLISQNEKEQTQKEDKKNSFVEHQPQQEVKSKMNESIVSGSVFASPSVRRLARELNVNLGVLTGTGRKGRITKDDLHAHIKMLIEMGSGIHSYPKKKIDFSNWGEVELRKLTKVNKITGKRLQQAWRDIPHVTQYDNADITDLDVFRKKLKKQGEKEKVKVTFLPFLLRAVSIVLKEMPHFNSSLDYDEENLVLKNYINIGVAIDTPSGLIVPSVRDINKKSIIEVSKELMDLSERARTKKLKPKELVGSTFTVSSLGGIGGVGFSPIVNPPEVAILGVSKSEWKPVYNKKSKSFEPRYIMPFSISYDHRVIDGAAGAAFTTMLSKALCNLENFND